MIFILDDERGVTVALTSTRPNPISIEEWVKNRVARLERRRRVSPSGVCQETVKNLEMLLWMMLVNLIGTPTTVVPPTERLCFVEFATFTLSAGPEPMFVTVTVKFSGVPRGFPDAPLGWTFMARAGSTIPTTTCASLKTAVPLNRTPPLW